MSTHPTSHPGPEERVSLTRVTDRLRELDCRPATRGRHVQAYCPTHDDHRPSLSIDHDGRTGQTLVYCQAGCQTTDVVAALGLSLSDLYDEPPRRPERTSGGRATGAARRVPAAEPRGGARPAARRRGPVCLDQHEHHLDVETARYTYTDEHGTVVGYKIRSRCGRSGCPETKLFSWRKIGAGGKERGGMPQPLPLYGLPVALAAIQEGRPVYVAEGEKDADALAAAGAVAVTMGAAAKGGGGSWKPHHTATLTGAHVIVCADRDDAGRRSAQIIAGQLTDVAASVRIVEAATGHDPHDHLEAGRGLDELVDITVLEDEPLEVETGDPRTAVQGPPPRTTATTPTSAPTSARHERIADVVPLPTAPDRPRGEHPVPGCDGWTYTPGVGVWSGTRQVLDWCPLVQRLVIVPGADATDIRDARVTVEVDGDVATVPLTDVRKGDAWARSFPLSPGSAGRVNQDALTNLVSDQARRAPRVWTVPQWHEGRLVLPPTDLLPHGYGRVAGTFDQARDVVQRIAEHERIAVVAGLAVAGLYTSPLGRGSLLVHLVGQTSRGKSSALTSVSSLLGDPSSVVRSWNSTINGITTSAVSLRCLPLVRDELGATGSLALRAGAAVDIVHRLTQGGDRDGATRTGDPRASRGSWSGCLLSSGNISIIDAAQDPAIAVRVIEIPAPFTPSARASDQLRAAAHSAYGHALHALTRGPDPTTVAEAITAAETTLTGHGAPRPSTPAAGRVWDHLAGGLAGACVLADVIDVPALAHAALTGTLALLPEITSGHVDETASPGAALLDAIRDHVSANPGLWPTRAGYTAASGEGVGYRAAGFAGLDLTSETTGTYADVDLAAFPRTVDQLATDAGVDRAVALRDLIERGHLTAPAGGKRAGLVRVDGRPHRAYLLSGDSTGEWGPVTPSVTPHPHPGGYGNQAPEQGRNTRNPGNTFSGGGVHVRVGAGARESRGEGTPVCVDCGQPYPPDDVEAGRDRIGGLPCLPCLSLRLARRRQAQAPERTAEPAGPTDEPTLPLDEGAQAAEDSGQESPQEPPGGANAAGGTPGESGERVAPRRAHSAAVGGEGSGEISDEMVTAARDAVLEDRTHDQTRAALVALRDATDGLLWIGGAPGRVGLTWMTATLRRGRGAIARGDIDSLRSPLPGDERGPEGWSPPVLTLDYVDPETAPVTGMWLTELDVNAQYLSSSGRPLSTGEPVLVTAESHGQARVDRLLYDDVVESERPAYVRLAADIDAGHPALAGMLTAGRTLPSPLARWLIRRRGIELPVDGVIAFPRRGGHLSPWRERIRDAREALREQASTEDGGGTAADGLRLLKRATNAGIGMLRSREHNHDEHLFQPAWFDAIVSEATVRALASLDRCTDAGRRPVGMYRDGAFFRSETPDPRPDQDAPGCRIGTGIGAWKIERHIPVSGATVEAHGNGPSALITHAKELANLSISE